jgi:hypothetical protein
VKLSKWNDSGVNCELNVVLSGDKREISGQYFYRANRMIKRTSIMHSLKTTLTHILNTHTHTRDVTNGKRFLSLN